MNKIFFSKYTEALDQWASNSPNEKMLGNHINLEEFYKNGSKEFQSIEENIKSLIIETIAEFDIASQANFKGDSYRFFMIFMSTLNRALKMRQMIEKNEIIEYFPINPIRTMKNEFERQFLLSMIPNISDEDVNVQKRNFIDWFLELMETTEEKFEDIALPLPYDKIEAILEGIYLRDYLANFRPVVGTKKLFRSPDPNRYTTAPNVLKDYFVKNEVSLIIDLRGIEETTRKGHIDKEYLNKLGIKHIILNFNEPRGTHENASGYVKKLMYLKNVLRDSIKEINATKGATLFHCHSGKDRTGVLAAMLQMIVGIDEKTIIKDYTKSGHDATPDRMEKVIKYLNSVGGWKEYLLSCGLTEEEISAIKDKCSLN